jgi:hypothetical protein
VFWTVAAIVPLLAAPSHAIADSGIGLCVSVSSDAGFDARQLEQMVLAILGNHPKFRIATTDCDTALDVSLFRFGDRFALTIRTHGAVPLRYTCNNAVDIKERLEEGIATVLRSDPVYLQRNIAEYSRGARLSHDIVVTGHNIFRLEIIETVTRGEKGATFAPGGAFAFSRGSRHVRVFGRVAGFGLPGDVRNDEIRLQFGLGVDAGLTYEFSETAPASFYLSTGAGFGFQRFEGSIDGRRHTANNVMVQVLLRAGVRVLRLNDFDLDLFVTGYLPLHPVGDPDSPLFGDNQKTWTPSLQCGIGVGF